MELELYLLETEEQMQSALQNYKSNLNKISAGRANPAILDGVKINYFETLTPINQISNILIPEPRQLLIKPFDQSMTKDIVAAINKSSIGIRAVDEGDKARITIPEVTTQRRKELVKSITNYTEQAKIQIRSARQSANKNIKSDEELSEDFQRDYQNSIQELTNEYISKVEQLTKTKENDLMSM